MNWPLDGVTAGLHFPWGNGRGVTGVVWERKWGQAVFHTVLGGAGGFVPGWTGFGAFYIRTLLIFPTASQNHLVWFLSKCGLCSSDFTT